MFRSAGEIRVTNSERTTLKEAASVEERAEECQPDNWGLYLTTAPSRRKWPPAEANVL